MRNATLVGILTVGTLVAALSSVAGAQLVVDPADYSLRVDGTTFTSEARLYVGSRTDGRYNAVYMFALPVLPVNFNLTTAHLDSMTGDIVGNPDFNVDLYGVGFLNSTEAIQVFHEGPDPELGAVLIQEDFLTPGTPANAAVGTNATGDANLRDYFRAFYAENPDYAGGSYLFLRLNADRVTSGNSYYEVYSGDAIAAGASLPEPGAVAVAVGAMAVGMLRRRRK